MHADPLPQPPPLPTARDTGLGAGPGGPVLDLDDGFDDGFDTGYGSGLDGVLDSAVPSVPAPLRRGHIRSAWRTTTLVAWVGIALGFGAVWRTSWTLGLSTWWLGPESAPRNVVVLLLPFYAPIAIIAAALRRLPWLPFIGLGGALVTALIAVGDIDRVPGLATIELALAASALLVSLGSLAGLPRPARAMPST